MGAFNYDFIPTPTYDQNIGEPLLTYPAQLMMALLGTRVPDVIDSNKSFDDVDLWFQLDASLKKEKLNAIGCGDQSMKMQFT